MEKSQLSAELRGLGKGAARRARAAGFVPAVVYGKKKEPIAIQVSSKQLEKSLATEHGLNVLFDLKIDGKQTHLTRVRDYQADLFSRLLTHVDFQVVDLTEKIDVEVPISYVGKAEGVKLGGILEQKRRVLELRCQVSKIPDQIEVDVSALQIGESIHADEIKLPAGVEFHHDQNFAVVLVVPPVKEEEVAVEAGADAESAATAEAAPSEDKKEES